MKNNNHSSVEVRAYNIKELAELYKVGRKTIVRWLKIHQKAIGHREGRYYTARQVKIIFDKLGEPSHLDEK